MQVDAQFIAVRYHRAAIVGEPLAFLARLLYHVVHETSESDN